MKEDNEMKIYLSVALVLSLIAMLIVACRPSQADINATSTKMAGDIFSTQTAQVPTLTSTPIALPSPTPDPTPTATPTPMAAADIFDKVAPSVAFIETNLGSGSGVLIEGGYIVTNAHIVWPFEEVRVAFPDGSEYVNAPILNWDLLIDIAVIGPLDTNIEPVKLIDGEESIIGSDLFLIGYPGEADQYPEPTISHGMLSRTRDWEPVGITYFQTDAAVAGGQSGGVLVTAYGEVIGISTFYFTDAFSLVASAVDIAPRLKRLIDGEDPSRIGNRRLPVEGAKLEHNIKLNNFSDSQMFVVYDRGNIEIEVESENDAMFYLIDPLGNPLLQIDDLYSGIESGATKTELDAPHFLILGHQSENPGDFQVRSDLSLTPYIDVDDGNDISIGQPVFANIDYPGDVDYFVIDLESGQVVDIMVDSVMIDPRVRVDFLGATGEEILTDDDSGDGLFGTNAKITYKAPHSGDYFVIVDEATPRFGGYILTVEEAPPGAEAVSPPPKSTPTITDSPFGPMAFFESRQYPFAIQYPAKWNEQPPQPEQGIVGYFQSEEGGIFAIVEEDISIIGMGKLTLNEYADFVLLAINGMVEDYQLVNRRTINNSQGLEAIVVEYTTAGGSISASRLIYLYEGEIGFNMTYMAGESRHNELRPMIEYSFNSFQATGSSLNDSTVYISRGLEFQYLGDFDSAIQEFSKAIKLYPELSEAYVHRGITYATQGKIENALSDFNQAITINPDDPEAYFNRGILYYERGELDRAIVDWTQAIDLNPDDNGDYYNNRGNAYRLEGDLDQAMADFNQAIAIDPMLAFAYYNRSLAHEANGDIYLAIADYDRAIEIDPEYAMAFHNRGVLHHRLGDLDQAFSDWTRAIALNPEKGLTYYYRSLIYDEQGEWEKAIADLERALELGLEPNLERDAKALLQELRQ